MSGRGVVRRPGDDHLVILDEARVCELSRAATTASSTPDEGQQKVTSCPWGYYQRRQRVIDKTHGVPRSAGSRQEGDRSMLSENFIHLPDVSSRLNRVTKIL